MEVFRKSREVSTLLGAGDSRHGASGFRQLSPRSDLDTCVARPALELAEPQTTKIAGFCIGKEGESSGAWLAPQVLSLMIIVVAASPTVVTTFSS